MSFASLNGERVISGRVGIPRSGIWTADVELASAIATTAAVTLIIANLTMIGHVYRAASFAGSRTVRVMGGFGGWSTQLPAQSYYDVNGVRLSMVLGDAAANVGEQIRLTTDRVLGQWYTRERMFAQNTLRENLGDDWYVDENGVTQAQARTNTSRITSEFNVISWSGGLGKFEIATEDLVSWMPARTFLSPTVSNEQSIAYTSISFDNNGKLRLEVLSSGP